MATSDGLEQVIIRGEGCRLLSAMDLQREMRSAENQIRENWLQEESGGRNREMARAIEAAQKKTPDTKCCKKE